MDDSFLPIELCERVIDVVGVSDRNNGTVDYLTLRACALVCCAWLPRTRYNLFYRVVLRTAIHIKRFLCTSARTAIGDHVRELELGLPRWEQPETGGWANLKEQPSIAALLYANLTKIETLVLSRVQWLYPRKHTRVLMSQFRSVRMLELYYVRFPCPGDLAQVLWSLPQLAELRCLAVYLLYANYPAAMVQHRVSPLQPQALQVMKLNGCATAGAFILHCMTPSARWLTSLSLRGSFLSWSHDTFQALSSFHQLLSLRLTLASPTVQTSLPPDTGLIGSYRRATEAILLQISVTNLRRIVVSFEPGLGTPDYLSGARRSLPLSEETSPEAEDPKWWSYGSQRRTTLETLLGGSLEQVIADPGPDGGRVKERFVGLRVLKVRMWDSQDGRDDAWWLAEVAKTLPTLDKLRLLRFDVMRDWPDDELLWSDA
ncbi:hypothetical protein C8T65DRAFT_738118 [Cerioporus squamosus]|nr:hypothetical protein C8T65DRAFT_738118 [Cerioporus squamosus]